LAEVIRIRWAELGEIVGHAGSLDTPSGEEQEENALSC
jgi:hypothetical protein